MTSMINKNKDSKKGPTFHRINKNGLESAGSNWWSVAKVAAYGCHSVNLLWNRKSAEDHPQNENKPNPVFPVGLLRRVLKEKGKVSKNLARVARTHFPVRNEYFGPMISASNRVVMTAGS